MIDVDEYDKLPNRIADRYAYNGEILDITQVCPNPDNSAYADIYFSVFSQYTYSGELHVIENDGVSGDWTVDRVDGDSWPVSGYPNIQQFEITYDFGSVFPGYLTIPNLKLRMDYSGNNIYSAEERWVTGYYEWDKGINFKPLEYKKHGPGWYQLIYQLENKEECPCHIICLPPSGASYTGVVAHERKTPECREQVASVYLSGNLSGDPNDVVFRFMYTGNYGAEFTYKIVGDVNPEAPEVSKWHEGAKVSIPYRTVNGTTLSGSTCRIEKYLTNQENIYIVSDWQDTDEYVYDFPLNPGRYAYRITYRGEFGDYSEPSEWVTIDV